MNIFFCWPPKNSSDEETRETPQMYLDAWVFMTQQTIREAKSANTKTHEDIKPGKNVVQDLEILNRVLQQSYNTTLEGGFQHTDITREAVQQIRKDRWCISHPLISEMLSEMNRVGFVRIDGTPYPDEKRFEKIT